MRIKDMSDGEGSDSEDYPSIRDSDSEGEESDSSGDEGVINTSDNDGAASDSGDDDDESDSSELGEGVEESDSSEDEVVPRNTVGDVPLEWYRDEKHIGYDIKGKKIKKKEKEDKLQSFLASADDSKNWRKIYDEYNDEEVELTKEDIKSISRLLEGKAPHGDFDPYAPYVDWFKWDDSKHPLSNAPEPKRRFIPSKSESKLVNKIKLAIRKGLIKPKKSKEEEEDEESVYPLWEDDSNSTEKNNHLTYIPAPKPKLPGHEESFNPSLEYIPTQEEVNSYQLMYEEDRPKFIPKRFANMRSIPAYENAVKECFERCLDLYLCPRVRKKRLNIDPESLKPKLPSRTELKPYPVACYLEYRGHEDAVTSVSVEASGQWIASGSLDGTLRIWEVETGRCVKICDIGEAVKYVAWNPNPEHSIVAVSAGQDILLLNPGCGTEEVQKRTKELLSVEMPMPDDSASSVSWLHDDKLEGIRLRHSKTVASVEWHRKGDYLSTDGKLVKKLETGLREVSSIAVHPSGDHIIVGSREGKLCWFDMDLSSKPYKTLKLHQKDINNVSFHSLYPLFATCSDDCTAYVFHGMVYSDLNQNPLIVPLEILRGHTSSNGRGVLDCKFHPRQPWLFTSGADSVIRLYCN
ncbi:hypothetical protein ACFX13_035242 [Malus domestica]